MVCRRCPHLPKICTQSDSPPSENADFDRFCLIVPQPWELVKKVQLSLIGSWPCAIHLVIDEPCALLLSPPTAGWKGEFLQLALHFTERELMFTFAICYRPYTSVVCNVRAPYSAGWNFRQCFYGIWYLGHLLSVDIHWKF